MYCRQCGAKLPEDAKFCSLCGADQKKDAEEKSVMHIAETRQAAVQGFLKKAKTSNLLSKAVGYGKDFLSADPTRSISKAASSCSRFWLPAIIANIVLFAFAACRNLAQLLTRSAGWFVHILVEYLREMVPGGSATFFGAEEQLALNVPALYSLFAPLTFIALLVLALEFAGMYLPFYMAKQKPDSIHPFLNVLATSTFPLTLTCLVNLLLGLIFPVGTLCTFITALAVHIILLQEGIKQLGTVKISPIWQIAIIGLVMCAILSFALGLAAKSALRDLLDMMAKSGMDFLSGAFGNIYSGLFSFLG